MPASAKPGPVTVFETFNKEIIDRNYLRGFEVAFDSNDKYLTGVCHGVAGFIDTKDNNGQLLIKGKKSNWLFKF